MSAIKYEYVGKFRIVITSCNRGGCTNYIQEKVNGVWQYKLDNCGVPMMSNYLSYSVAYCQGKIKFGQEVVRDDNCTPVTRKQITKEVMRMLGVNYFVATMLTHKHNNRWGLPTGAWLIAYRTRQSMGLEPMPSPIPNGLIPSLKALISPNKK